MLEGSVAVAKGVRLRMILDVSGVRDRIILTGIIGTSILLWTSDASGFGVEIGLPIPVGREDFSFAARPFA